MMENMHFNIKIMSYRPILNILYPKLVDNLAFLSNLFIIRLTFTNKIWRKTSMDNEIIFKRENDVKNGKLSIINSTSFVMKM